MAEVLSKYFTFLTKYLFLKVINQVIYKTNKIMSLESATQKVMENLENASESLGSTVKFSFGEGVIFIDGNASPNTVTNNDEEADCTVAMELSDFQDMLSGELNSMSAFMEGKMQIDGEMSVAMKLQSIFGG